jgi:hypothetical protein
VTRDLGFSGLIRRTALFSRLLRHTRGCGGSILTRILSGIKKNRSNNHRFAYVYMIILHIQTMPIVHGTGNFEIFTLTGFGKSIFSADLSVRPRSASSFLPSLLLLYRPSQTGQICLLLVGWSLDLSILSFHSNHDVLSFLQHSRNIFCLHKISLFRENQVIIRRNIQILHISVIYKTKVPVAG